MRVDQGLQRNEAHVAAGVDENSGAALLPLRGRQQDCILDAARLPRSRELKRTVDAVEDAACTIAALLREDVEAVNVHATAFSPLHGENAIAEL